MLLILWKRWHDVNSTSPYLFWHKYHIRPYCNIWWNMQAVNIICGPKIHFRPQFYKFKLIHNIDIIFAVCIYVILYLWEKDETLECETQNIMIPLRTYKFQHSAITLFRKQHFSDWIVHSSSLINFIFNSSGMWNTNHSETKPYQRGFNLLKLYMVTTQDFFSNNEQQQAKNEPLFCCPILGWSQFIALQRCFLLP